VFWVASPRLPPAVFREPLRARRPQSLGSLSEGFMKLPADFGEPLLAARMLNLSAINSSTLTYFWMFGFILLNITVFILFYMSLALLYHSSFAFYRFLDTAS
jgi:hypothetical protein